MRLASTNDSLVLLSNGEHPARKTKFQGNLSYERMTNPAIDRQLLFQRER